jgi:hypothetical protein
MGWEQWHHFELQSAGFRTCWLLIVTKLIAQRGGKFCTCFGSEILLITKQGGTFMFFYSNLTCWMTQLLLNTFSDLNVIESLPWNNQTGIKLKVTVIHWGPLYWTRCLIQFTTTNQIKIGLSLPWKNQTLKVSPVSEFMVSLAIPAVNCHYDVVGQTLLPSKVGRWDWIWTLVRS